MRDPRVEREKSTLQWRDGRGGGVGVVLWWKWECFAAGREGNDNERWWVTGFGVVTVGKEGR